ncbi:TetR/AcrR family transcriptional regulator [Galactobacter sp.]|uniref:TetR/AcrR family transcriptional regulator n=1 Tax=Galactobacter sp. TaxID=2676125 RepID=UPI0025B8CE77|nr:TetR/AcrR family transcriptional regulator [Galactobacter sp.]
MQARAEMREGILRLGREQLAERGAANLSVREISRGLGVASSAIYRHVASRDELLTLLLVDAYEDLARVALEAEGRAATPSQQLDALVRGMRRWAVTEPSRWGLIYGTPVPGFAAPRESTTGPGTKVMARFAVLLASGRTSDDASTPPSEQLSHALLDGLADLGVDLTAGSAAEIALAWASLVGVISAEVFGQFGPGFRATGEEFLQRWIDTTVERFGLEG